MHKYVVSIYDELTEKKSSHVLEDISTYPTARLSFDAIKRHFEDFPHCSSSRIFHILEKHKDFGVVEFLKMAKILDLHLTVDFGSGRTLEV